MVKNLDGGGMWQMFPSKEQALHDYLQARVRGTVVIVRNPGDTDAKFGPREDAEDLPID
jgi:hypothetical protein